MTLALLLALLDADRPSGSPLALELKLVSGAPAVELTLVNRSSKALRVVKPGDGSEIGWREPFVYWTAEARSPGGGWTPIPAKGYGRCGHFAADWEKDVVELVPGGRLELRDWLRDLRRTFEFTPGHRYRVVAHYAYRARPSAKACREEPPQAALVAGPMKGVKPFALRSPAVEFDAP